MVNGEQQLPDGWTWVAIGDIAKNINPGFPSGRHNQENIGVPHIRPMNISRNGDVDLSVVKYIEATDYLPLLQGDVLFNNTNSPELVGKTTYIRQDTNWAYSNHMTRIRLDKEVVYASWVSYALHYLFLDGYFKQNCRHHVNQASVGSGFLSQNVKIPLPPLPKQERIVAKIEELFTQLDAGTSALAKVQAGLRRYKASVLKAAYEGKLVPQEANDESAIILYKKILDERIKRWESALIKRGSKARNTKYSEPELPEIENGELPSGWTWASLDSLTYRVTYGITVRPKYVEEGVPIISAREIRSGDINLEISHKISNQDYEKLRHNCILYYDDVLFSKTGTIGHVARVKQDIPLSVSQNVAVLSPVVWSKYLEMVLRSPTIQKLAQSKVKTTAIPDLQLGLMKRFPIPLPPLEEQRRIVAEVERRLSVARQVENTVEEALVRAARLRLRQSILRHAFEGKLS
jgi:type I restriction enzyme, S subunit